jgi:hypothetical protein
MRRDCPSNHFGSLRPGADAAFPILSSQPRFFSGSRLLVTKALHAVSTRSEDITGCFMVRRSQILRRLGPDMESQFLPTWEKQIQASGGLEKENTVGQAPGPRSEEGGPPP